MRTQCELSVLDLFGSVSLDVATEAMYCYVYILQSLSDPDAFYVGQTRALSQRLEKHNAGEVTHTSKYRPWRIKTAVAFTDSARAIAFEKYLKTASGRAFAKKRL